MSCSVCCSMADSSAGVSADCAMPVWGSQSVASRARIRGRLDMWILRSSGWQYAFERFYHDLRIHPGADIGVRIGPGACFLQGRSEEHTSELQSRPHLVCRLLLEKKKKNEIRGR